MLGFLSKLFYIIALRKSSKKNKTANLTDATTNGTVEKLPNQMHRIMKRDLTYFNTNLSDTESPSFLSDSVDFLFKNTSNSTGESFKTDNGDLTEKTSSSFVYFSGGGDSNLGENFPENCLFNFNLVLWLPFAIISTVCLCIYFSAQKKKENHWIYHLKGITAIGWIGVFLQGYRDFICSVGQNSSVSLSLIFTLDILLAASFLAIFYHLIMILLAVIQEKLTNSNCNVRYKRFDSKPEGNFQPV